MNVKNIVRKVIVANPNISLRKVAKIMSEKKVGSIVFMKSGKVLGILTEKDIVRNYLKLNKKASSVMSKNPVCIDIHEDIDSAARLMQKFRIKRLLVSEKNKLVGIISVTDIIANSEDLNEFF